MPDPHDGQGTRPVEENEGSDSFKRPGETTPTAHGAQGVTQDSEKSQEMIMGEQKEATPDERR